MTTENLKGEMMSAEQLDAVAGGNNSEIKYDDNLLYMYGFKTTYYSMALRMNVKWNAFCHSVIEAWGKAGIICIYNEYGENEYYLKNSDGSKTRLSHDDAGDYIRRNFEPRF